MLVPIGYKDRRDKQPTVEPQDKQAVREQKRALDALESGQELSSEIAQHLQPHMGNQALQELLGNAAPEKKKGANAVKKRRSVEIGGSQVEIEEEEEVQELEVVEEGVEVTELEAPQMGGGNPGGADGGGDGGGNAGREGPWDMGFLFGGDDDAPADSKVSSRMGRSPIRRSEFNADEPFFDDEFVDDPDPEGHSEYLEERWPAMAVVPRQHREGDAIYLAVEAAILHSSGGGTNMVAGKLDVEALAQRTGPVHPIGRATLIGRFLFEESNNIRVVSLGRVLGWGLGTICPESWGYVSAVARLSNLAVCVEAHEGGGVRTDNAVTLSLDRRAWFDAFDAARVLAKSNRLYAAEIAHEALGAALQSDPGWGLSRTVTSSQLGVAALERVVPSAAPVVVPHVEFEPEEVEQVDQQAAAVDDVLERFTSGASQTESREPTHLNRDLLQPILQGASALVSSLGRAQVEFASAALSVCRIQADTPVQGILDEGDRALRQLAQQVVKCGNSLNGLAGQELVSCKHTLDEQLTLLRTVSDGLVDVRQRVFGLLVGAMEDRSSPRHGSESVLLSTSGASSAPTAGVLDDGFAETLRQATRHGKGEEWGGMQQKIDALSDNATARSDLGLHLLCRTLCGNMSTARGISADGIKFLSHAVSLAYKEGDTLTVAGEGSVLVGLLASQSSWDEAEMFAVRVEEAARRRRNWIGVADGIISQANVCLGQGTLAKAVNLLVQGAIEMNTKERQAAMVLFRARLGEIRRSSGAKQFDPIFEKALQLI